ncbi:MAG: tetratricopeptide repeat protein [Acidobacteria bacterium]|nr:tetratricopeptide repeat protein [Acidobacteriota bacterium]
MKKIRFLLMTVFTLALLIRLAPTTWAQTGGIEGQALVRQPDGSKQPAVKALVELYRLGIKGYYKITTDKNGRFAHIGLPYGDYVIAVSGEGVNPYYEYGVRIPPGSSIEKTFELLPGNGQRLTLEEIEKYRSQTPQQQAASQAEQQKQLEEAMKKQEEQRKATARDAELIKHFEAAKQLASASQYEQALSEYKLATEASLDHPQIYVVLGKMAEAYFNLGVERNNSGQRQLGLESFTLAAETAKKGTDMVPADKAVEKPKYFALYAQAKGVIAKLDNKQVDEAVAVYQQLMEMQPTPEEKLKAQNAIGDVYLNAARANEAMEVYRKVLEADPNNLDALRGLGMALVQTGNESKYPEVIEALTKFTDKAAKDAATDAKRAQEIEEAKQIITALKEAEKQKKKK